MCRQFERAYCLAEMAARLYVGMATLHRLASLKRSVFTQYRQLKKWKDGRIGTFPPRQGMISEALPRRNRPDKWKGRGLRKLNKYSKVNAEQEKRFIENLKVLL
jgi:hypothetical protein